MAERKTARSAPEPAPEAYDVIADGEILRRFDTENEAEAYVGHRQASGGDMPSFVVRAARG